MSRKTKRTLRILASLLCVVVVCSSTSFFQDYSVSAETTLTDLENKLSNLKDKEKEIKKELQKTQSNLKDEEARQQQLKYQISNLQAQIDTLNQRVVVLGDEIDQKTVEIENMQKSIDENYDLFLKRLKAMYMSDDATVLSVLFGKSTFAEFLSMAETISSIAEHDDALLKKMAAEKAQIEQDKADIESHKAQLESDRSELMTKQEEVDQARADSADALEELKALEAKTKKTYSQIVADREAVDEEIRQYILAHQDNSATLSEGGWLWPVGGYKRLSDGYGWRDLYGKQQFHKGIDIPCPAGTPIRAAKSGIVIRANYSSSYGNVVIIDHGSGYSTLYAHNTSLAVSVGQAVSQGQTIAYAGTTGDSYGNHCHFEVRVNGATTNPLGFVVATG